jgi:predicted CXXCH cytochrome family protein
VASGVGERYGRGGPASFERMTSRHPIGAEQHPRGPGDNLVHPNSLDPRIRLFDGRVGCGSCHSPYAREHALLVMSNDRSALCLSCHSF